MTSSVQSGTIPLSKLNTKIKDSKQREHIYGNKRWIEENDKCIAKGCNPKSFIFPDVDIQKIVDEAVNNPNTKTVYKAKSPYPIQYFSTKEAIGKVYDKKSGGYIETKRVAIVHSSKGTHIYPVIERDDNND